MPPTVDGFLLLGWMEKDEATYWLTNECWFDPAMSNLQAEEVWEKYKTAVDGLPERKPASPKRLPIAPSLKPIVDNFLLRTRGPEVADVISINPLELIVYQLYVVTDRANQSCETIGRKGLDEMLPSA